MFDVTVIAVNHCSLKIKGSDVIGSSDVTVMALMSKIKEENED